MNTFYHERNVIDYFNSATFDALCEFAKRDEEIKTWEKGDKKSPKPSRILLCVNEDKKTHRIAIRSIDEKKIGIFEKLKITLLGSCRLSKVLPALNASLGIVSKGSAEKKLPKSESLLNASLGIVSKESAEKKLPKSESLQKTPEEIGQFLKALNLLLNEKVSSHNEKLKKISVFSKEIILEKYDILKKIAGLVEGRNKKALMKK